MAVKWYSNHDWKIHPGIRRDAWIVLVDQDRVGVRPEMVWDDQDNIPRCSRWAYLWDIVQEQLKRDGLKK